MAKLKFVGLDDYVRKLNRLDADTRKICKRVIYVGADVVADTIRENMLSIRTDDRNFVPENEMRTGPRYKELLEMQKAFGITPIKSKGISELDAKLGFDGFNGLSTDYWPKGRPNAMVARMVESGTSWMNKQPFIQPAINSSRKFALKLMEKEFQKEIEKIMK